jgi:hypothetical protein
MTQLFFVSPSGAYLGSFDGAPPPAGAIEVAGPPADARQRWDGSRWLPLVDLDPLDHTFAQRGEQTWQS